MWYSLAELLETWAPYQDWPNVSGALDMVVKALQVVGETLEKPSTWVTGLWAQFSYSFVSCDRDCI